MLGLCWGRAVLGLCQGHAGAVPGPSQAGVSSVRGRLRGTGGDDAGDGGDDAGDAWDDAGDAGDDTVRPVFAIYAAARRGRREGEGEGRWDGTRAGRREAAGEEGRWKRMAGQGRAGAMPGPCWGRAGAMLGLCWGCAGAVLGLC